MSLLLAAATAGRAWSLQDLAGDSGASVLIPSRSDADGRGRFVLGGGSGGLQAESVAAARAYLVVPRGHDVFTLSVSGLAWSTASLKVPLVAGLNLIGYPGPSVPAAIGTADRLLGLAPNAVFLARVEPNVGGPPGATHFEVFVPGLGIPAFPIEPGRGYILVETRSETLALPGP
ncbi:MAG: hypothetical protein HY303_01015 [Candidatus Wallbacteria bacterium]|nr:hypothetical protein [Candidatus Wallbacteria bacterium]